MALRLYPEIQTTDYFAISDFIDRDAIAESLRMRIPAIRTLCDAIDGKTTWQKIYDERRQGKQHRIDARPNFRGPEVNQCQYRHGKKREPQHQDLDVILYHETGDRMNAPHLASKAHERLQALGALHDGSDCFHVVLTTDSPSTAEMEGRIQTGALPRRY